MSIEIFGFIIKKKEKPSKDRDLELVIELGAMLERSFKGATFGKESSPVSMDEALPALERVIRRAASA